ncbi:MAG: DnaJ domain-containing protein [Gammaproteobacteria bacterium]|nr:DnaJ domain-containing protein [Gammaproteobacteria bacterium]
MPHPSIEQLVSQLEQLLPEYPTGLSEYELIRTLSQDQHSALANAKINTSLSLFQTHFILFHTLYLLRDQLWQQEQGHLEITALKIQLHPYIKSSNDLNTPDKLREFYLDLDNLEKTETQDVDDLLKTFWEYYLNPAERRSALADLGLEDPVDFNTIKQQYRKLAMEHHPDRGGDTEKLQSINAAMEWLSRYKY